MSRIEVCTWDCETGCTMVDHVWKVRHGARKVAKQARRIRAWAHRAARMDVSTSHVVYVREV